MTGGLKMGVNVAAHTRHTFLGSAPPPELRALDFQVEVYVYAFYRFSIGMHEYFQ